MGHKKVKRSSNIIILGYKLWKFTQGVDDPNPQYKSPARMLKKEGQSRNTNHVYINVIEKEKVNR